MEVFKPEIALSNIKEDLGIAEDDNLQNTVISRLIKKVVDHFKFEYNQEEVDEKYSFIIEDCVIKRYNRRKAEGAKSISVEGHSVTYEDKYEFEPYHEKLVSDLDQERNKIKPGRWYVM